MTKATADTAESTTSAELQHEIELTRDELGATIDELVARVDVKARITATTDDLKRKAAETGHRLTSADSGTRVKSLTAAGAAAAAVALLVVRSRNRRELQRSGGRPFRPRRRVVAAAASGSGGRSGCGVRTRAAAMLTADETTPSAPTARQ